MADIPVPDITEYVVEKIDDAIKNEWIKVYYQPVIRTITMELCGMESLSRWIDPEVGFFPPDKFIGALEESKQIHKLDRYIVEHVCKDLSALVEQKKPVVPVSVNFSRLDFVMMDMVDVVENAVRKYDIPRDLIHVEITESMIASDEELMARIIEDFRKAGYEIWMDDFGSGYSSLNLLKDYQFDLLKLDMKFLSSFTDRSKSIMRFAINMAKDIGVKTLAEGVETKEHVEFLKKVGCGKLQGYYFSKPQPLDLLLEHLNENNIKSEERQWRNFYEAASIAVRDTDSPLEILFDDGKEFKTLFMNEAYRNQISFNNNEDYEEMDRRIYHTGSPLLKKYREMADAIEESGNVETFYYSDNGVFLRFTGQSIAKHGDSYIIKASIYNITQDENTKEAERLDSKLRDLILLYELVDIINIKNRDISPLMGRFKYIDARDYVYGAVSDTASYFANNYVFPSQREDFKAFLDVDTMKERVEAGKKGHIEEAYRIKQKNGNYEWREVVLMMIPNTNGEEYLLCFKSLPTGLNMNEPRYPHIDDKSERIFYTIWENLMWNCSIKFFWKDAKRRFLGVSQSFLDFYGIKSKEDIIGKTDEDMHWHVDDEYMMAEMNIIKKGQRIKDLPGQCIVNGVVHNIICNKMPLYDDGEIVGFVGYFIDGEEELARVNRIEGPARVDNITNLMNARSFLDAMIGYAIQYSDNNKNYGLILMENATHDRIIQTYGKEVSNKLLYQIGRKIIEVTEQSCAVGRTKNSLFAVMTTIDSKEELEALRERLVKNIEEIRTVEGENVTVRMKSASKLRSEPGITDENIYQAVIDMLVEMDSDSGNKKDV